MGWGVHSHYVVKPNIVLRLGWGFDNIQVPKNLGSEPIFGSETKYGSEINVGSERNFGSKTNFGSKFFFAPNKVGLKKL